MKKFLAVLLAVVLCMSVCSVAVFAAGEDIVVSAKGGTAARGEEIRVPINLDANKGFVTLGIEIDYDADVLEIVCENHEEGKNCVAKRAPKVEKKEDFEVALDYACSNAGQNSQKHTVKPYVMQWAYATVEEDICETGEIAAVTFKVKDDAAFGDTKVEVKVTQASGFGSATRTFVGGEATVTVACTNHTAGTPEVTKEPTCTEKGTKVTKCKDCGATMKTEDVAATGHDWGNWEGSADAKCGEQGEEKRVCKNDATHVETRKTDALEHLWDEGTVTTEPTCEADGVKTFKCTRTGCDGSKTEAIAKLGHKYDNGTVTTEPTCETDGVKTFTCANDATHTYTEVVAKLGHDWGEWEETTAPDCDTPGEETRVCANDASHVETNEIEPYGHTADPDSWTVETEPTLEAEGLRVGGKCEECGADLEDEVMPKLTNVLEGDKIFAVDEDFNEVDLDIKVEVADDEPFSGYVEAWVQTAVAPANLDKVDGNTLLEGYMVNLVDLDRYESLGDKAVKITLNLSADLLAKYENLVVYSYTEDNGKEVYAKLAGATVVDGVVTLTATAAELDEMVLVIAGTAIETVVPPVEDNDAPTTSPETGDSATAIAFAIVMMAIAAGALVVTGKKVRA